MMKPIAAMTDHEMLVELLQEKRRGETRNELSRTF